MKNYNIEDQLKRKFKERTITPSAEAWDRIAYNRQLQKKKKKYTMWYWSSAAVVIISFGVLLSGLISHDDTTIIIPQQTIVEKQINFTNVVSEDEKTIQKEITNEVVFQEKKISINSTSASENNITARGEVKAVNTVTNADIAKANEVAIAIHELALVNNGQVTDNEVDSLLHKAQREIAIERLKNKNLPTDDTALLNEAEKEMEDSFRDKTFSIFKLKFKTIKIAFKDKQ